MWRRSWTDDDDRSSPGLGGEKVNEVAKRHRIRACVLGRFAEKRQHREETGYQKPAWVLDR